MQLNTPWRLLAIAAATALVFTACGGSDSGNNNYTNPPSNDPGGYPSGPSEPNTPGTTTTETDTSTSDTTTSDTTTSDTTTSDTTTSDTTTSDTTTSDTTTSDTTTTDPCADPSSTDTACAPTAAAAEPNTLPMEYTGTDKYDEVTISLTPAVKRSVTIEVDTTQSTATGVTLTQNTGFTDATGKKTVKVSVPANNPMEFVSLKVTDAATGAEIAVTPDLQVCDPSNNGEKACAPTGATVAPTTVADGDPVTFTLTPLSAAYDSVFGGRQVTITTSTAGVTLDGGTSATVACDAAGTASVTVGTGSLPSGTTIELTVEDVSGHKIPDKLTLMVQ